MLSLTGWWGLFPCARKHRPHMCYWDLGSIKDMWLDSLCFQFFLGANGSLQRLASEGCQQAKQIQQIKSRLWCPGLLWSKWYSAEEGSVLFKRDPSVHSGLQKTTLAVPFLTSNWGHPFFLTFLPLDYKYTKNQMSPRTEQYLGQWILQPSSLAQLQAHLRHLRISQASQNLKIKGKVLPCPHVHSKTLWRFLGFLYRHCLVYSTVSLISGGG